MEEADDSPALWIKPSHVRSLETVAMDAGQSEIPKFSFATVLPRNDVIDLERRRVKW